MNIRAVIWDIDGTLVDSEPLHLCALRNVCSQHGADIADLADDHFIGVSVKDVWAALHDRFAATLGFADWLHQLNSYYVAHSFRLRMIPGASNTIRRLRLAGFRQAAASNSIRIVVNANLNVLGVSDLMDCIVSLDDVQNGKPDPEPYLRALAEMGLAPWQACAVEDSATGVQSARAAGLHVLGLRDRNLGAQIHIDGLAEIPGRLIVSAKSEA